MVLFPLWFLLDPAVLIMGGGWGSTAEQQPHAVDEFRACTKSLNNSEMTPGYIYEMFDTRQAREEECAPWYANIRPGKMPFIKYQEAAMGALPSNWVAVGDAVMKVNPIYGTGCTKAMMDVVTLDSLLHRVPSQQDLAPGFRTSRNTKANNYGWSTTDLARGETLATGAGLLPCN
ncbi:hypothetical protein FRB96_002858 [Tulasnella sp. 330]|nr:hypothetical protein FRB96_002858 [Tulasnella sp. 330]